MGPGEVSAVIARSAATTFTNPCHHSACIIPGTRYTFWGQYILEARGEAPCLLFHRVCVPQCSIPKFSWRRSWQILPRTETVSRQLLLGCKNVWPGRRRRGELRMPPSCGWRPRLSICCAHRVVDVCCVSPGNHEVMGSRLAPLYVRGYSCSAHDQVARALSTFVSV